MVRGRRVRAVVTCARNDVCCSPDAKRRDQKPLLNGKLTHTVLTSNNKTHTITEFFQAVEIDDTKHIINESMTVTDDIKSLKTSRRKLLNNTNIIITNGETIQTDIDVPTTPTTKRSFDEISNLSTPHRIELCGEIVEPPKSHVTVKSTISKARRRLNTNQEINTQEVKCSQKDNHKLTEYFPVRRSVRKTKKTVLEEKQRSLEQTLRNGLEEGLEVRSFEGKGRGVVASKHFYKGDFVVEYSGDLIDTVQAKEREEKYAQDQNTGCYMYYFRHNSQQYCIDATAETGRLGRLVNHSRNGNLVTRTIMVDNVPRLVLIAKDDIKVGEEVLYDYGDRSKESLRHHPWLAY